MKKILLLLFISVCFITCSCSKEQEEYKPLEYEVLFMGNDTQIDNVKDNFARTPGYYDNVIFITSYEGFIKLLPDYNNYSDFKEIDKNYFDDNVILLYSIYLVEDTPMTGVKIKTFAYKDNRLLVEYIIDKNRLYDAGFECANFISIKKEDAAKIDLVEFEIYIEDKNYERAERYHNYYVYEENGEEVARILPWYKSVLYFDVVL